MLSAIIATLMTKNVRAFITRRKKEPVRQPSVRKMKYREVAKAASLSVHPIRLHQNLWGGGVRAHVNAHVAHDAEERELHDGFAEKLHAVRKARGRAVAVFFGYRRYGEENGSGDADCQVDGEEHPPSEAEVGYVRHCSPHGDVGGEEGGDGLDELPEGER